MGDFFIWLAAIVCFITVAAIFGARKEKLRREQYEKIAPQLGFTPNRDRSGFVEHPPQDLLESFKRLPMGKYKINNKSFSFILIKDETGKKSFIFDFCAGKLASDNSAPWKFTAYLEISNRYKLPKFVIWPRKEKSRWQIVASKEIEVQGNRVNEHNVLNGDEEERIRELFRRPRIASFFEQNPRAYVEGNGDVLAYYKLMQIIPAQEIPAFYAEAKEAFSRFSDT